MPGLRRRKRLPDGSFGPFEDVFGELSPEEKVEQLEAINAQLAYESVMKDLKIEELSSNQEELSSNQAELTYQLMMKGVL